VILIFDKPVHDVITVMQ